MFKKLALGLAMAALFLVGSAQAENKKSYVLGMMEKAVSHYNSVGQDQAFKDFDTSADFKTGEYYVIAQSLDDGRIIYHGANKKLVGKNLMKVKDTDGKPFVKEMVELARGEGKGWVSYKWPHPVTKQISQKYTYVTRIAEITLLIGYYE
jgi:cytochrome c